MKKEDPILFDDMSFSDLLKDIYTNAKVKDDKIQTLVDKLSLLVKSTSEAVVIVPLIKEYLDIGVKNDDHLVKLAAIVQRGMSNSKGNSSGIILTEEEKRSLLKSAGVTPMKKIG